MKEDRQYGYETKSLYPNMVKDFYTLNSKVKLVRAFELIWQLSNNNNEKNYVY